MYGSASAEMSGTTRPFLADPATGLGAAAELLLASQTVHLLGTLTLPNFLGSTGVRYLIAWKVPIPLIAFW